LGARDGESSGPDDVRVETRTLTGDVRRELPHRSEGGRERQGPILEVADHDGDGVRILVE